MKVLHASVMSEPAVGVLKQLEAEALSSEKLGITWDARFYCNSAIDSVVIVQPTSQSSNKLMFKISFYRWLWKKTKQYDQLLLRYSFHDPLQFIFMLMCPIPVVLVHHTLEGPELLLVKGVLPRIKYYAESVLGPLSLSAASGIVAVTHEILEYEVSRRWYGKQIPTHIYPNGILYTDKLPAKSEVSVSRSPVILFVSSVYAPWQGLEELLQAAKEYTEEFQCHVVGTLTAEQEKLLEQDHRFIAHGKKDSEFIQTLIKSSDVGLSALTLYKKNMESACTLKVREYMMSGLCTYAGYDDVFPVEFKYFRRGPVDLSSICNYALECRSFARDDVKNTAKEYIDKFSLVENLYEFLKNIRK